MSDTKTCRCHFCGGTKDVHYSLSVFDPVVADQRSDVCVCEYCAEKYRFTDAAEYVGPDRYTNRKLIERTEK